MKPTRVALFGLGTLTVLSLILSAFFAAELSEVRKASLEARAEVEAARREYRSLTDAAALDDLLAAREAGALLVDLRDRSDYAAAHIEGFDNIAWKDNGELFESWISPHRRDKQVILICYGGNRSSRAFERLAVLGFTKVADFTPGWTGYLAAKGETYVPAAGDCGCPE